MTKNIAMAICLGLLLIQIQTLLIEDLPERKDMYENAETRLAGSEMFAMDKTPLDSDDNHELEQSPICWFMENVGQSPDDSVRFTYSNHAISAVFRNNGYIIRLDKRSGETEQVEIIFEGTNPVEPLGQDEHSHRTNYLRGSDTEDWYRDVRSFGELLYPDIYDGIDLIFRISDEGLKYDFIVHPGGNPDQIAWRYQGTDSVFQDDNGDLIIGTGTTEMKELAPVSFQDVDGRTITIRSKFHLEGFSVGFEVGTYDHSRDLIIDPLIFSTYLGGDGTDSPWHFTMDSEDNIYVTGYTDSTDFPVTSGTNDTVHNGGYDVFVAKLSANGSALEFSTFIGGEGYDWGYGISVDEDGFVYVGGHTNSEDFPVTNGAYQTTPGGESDVFVMKLSPDGSQLLYSTYLGGSDNDYLRDITIDDDGNAYTLGYGRSLDYPTTPGAHDRDNSDGGRDSFVTKLNADGSNVIFSTFFGGEGDQYGESLALDYDRNVYVAGSTESENVPTTEGAYDTTFNGGEKDVIICKFSSDGSKLEFSTFIGSGSDDTVQDIDLDAENNIYVTGHTTSENFPTTQGAFDKTQNGNLDAFVLKMESNGTDLIYSTFLGGDQNDLAYGVTISAGGEVFITGDTKSEDFPVTEDSSLTSYDGTSDVFLTGVSAEGTELVHSVYLGGTKGESGFDIYSDPSGAIYLTGYTTSADFPVTSHAFDQEYNSSYDCFILKYFPGNPNPTPTARFTASPPSGVNGTLFTFNGERSTNRLNMTSGLKYKWDLEDDGIWDTLA